MKTSKNIFILLMLFFCSANVFHSQSIRQKYSINENWKFFLNKNHSILTDLNLVPTESINIPHTWNRDDAFDKTDKYYRGEGVYEKTFYIPMQSQSKRIFIYFEGANQVSNIWFNGRFIGEHIGGYSAFSFELTESIKYGEENRLFVKVNNEHDLDIPPLDADFTFYGGIYRDVYLIITNDIHFDLLDDASTGIYITPKISNKSDVNDTDLIDKIQLNLTSANIDFSNKSYFNINVGSNYDFIDNAGVVWHSDKKYVNDSWGYTNGKQIGSKHKIIGTFDDPVYQTALMDLDNYMVDLTDGSYRISLLFSDISYDKSPTNLITINFNNEEEFYFELPENKNFIAHEFSFETDITGNTGLKLFLSSSINRTILNGIQIIKLN